MNGYTKMRVELPQFPRIARIINRDKKRIYINSAADPDAKIDYLMAPGQTIVVIGPEHPLPEGKPE